jgi:hypothetical protein
VAGNYPDVHQLILQKAFERLQRVSATNKVMAARAVQLSSLVDKRAHGHGSGSRSTSLKRRAGKHRDKGGDRAASLISAVSCSAANASAASSLRSQSPSLGCAAEDGSQSPPSSPSERLPSLTPSLFGSLREGADERKQREARVMRHLRDAGAIVGREGDAPSGREAGSRTTTMTDAELATALATAANTCRNSRSSDISCACMDACSSTMRGSPANGSPNALGAPVPMIARPHGGLGAVDPAGIGLERAPSWQRAGGPSESEWHAHGARLDTLTDAVREVSSRLDRLALEVVDALAAANTAADAARSAAASATAIATAAATAAAANTETTRALRAVSCARMSIAERSDSEPTPTSPRVAPIASDEAPRGEALRALSQGDGAMELDGRDEPLSVPQGRSRVNSLVSSDL